MSQLNSAGILACGAVLGAFGCGLRLPRPALPIPGPDPWAVAARIESLGIVRRIPGKLDLRYMGAPTRERLTRPIRLN